MPANLTPQYHEAERRFKAAKEPDEKLAHLEEMIRLLPKHKGTDHLFAELKKKRSVLKKEVSKAKKKAKRGASFRIPREGGGQVVLLGGANTGKSSLLAALTNAEPEIADYPYATQEPVPGMMHFEDAPFQLIDTPAITEEFMFTWMVEVTRSADAALLVADLGTDTTLESVETVREKLAEKKIELVPETPDADLQASVRYIKTLLLCNKTDAAGADDRFEVLEELLGDAFPMLRVSAKTGEGLAALKETVFRFLDVVRVYTKVPGKKADKGDPFVIPTGSTVIDLARVVHKELAEGLEFARLWGEGVYDGQRVKRDHVLHDGDVLELHI